MLGPQLVAPYERVDRHVCLDNATLAVSVALAFDWQDERVGALL